MNDATRKKLEAAGWRVFSDTSSFGEARHRMLGVTVKLEGFQIYINADQIAALRAFIEAFEQEGKG